MKPRTIIGIVFIVASFIKLATIWGIIKWDWFTRISEEPWVTYFCICLLIYVGVSLIIDSYRRDPDQWLLRPLPIGEDGKRICCSVHYGGELLVSDKKLSRANRKGDKPFGKSPKICNFAFATIKIQIYGQRYKFLRTAGTKSANKIDGQAKN